MGVFARFPSRNGRSRGFTLTELLVAIGITGLLLAVLLPAIQASRESSRRIECCNHLHQWGTALHAFEATRGRFPGAYAAVRQKFGLYSPHVALLEYVEQSTLHDKLVVDGLSKVITEDGWRGTPDWAKEPLPAFLCPADGGNWGTNYVFCTGQSLRPRNDRKGGVFGEFFGLPASGIVDGLSNTIGMSEQLIAPVGLDRFDPQIHYWFTGLGEVLSEGEVEATLRVRCQSPGYASAPFDKTDGWQWYLVGYGRTWYNHAGPPNSRLIDCSAFPYPTLRSEWGVHTARSRHPGGVNTLAMDGATRLVNESIDESVWRLAATVNDGGLARSW